MLWPKKFPGIVILWLLLCLFHSQNANGFIVPEQVASVSNAFLFIPPITKGTDSRVGFGFRLGEHGYFQVLVELGPQKYTRPLGDPRMNEQSFSKRQQKGKTLPVQPQVKSDAVQQLRQLYKLATTSTEATSSKGSLKLEQ
ncbi:hypothetical protein ACLKA7_004506 [Drosophila subpalustris]